MKRGQSHWESLWSEDEATCARACNAEVQFFENNDFSKVADRWVIGLPQKNVALTSFNILRVLK